MHFGSEVAQHQLTWDQLEVHRMFGFEFPSTSERAQLLEEAVQIIRKIMTQDNTTFEGRYYALSGATYRPRPVQQPQPPIWMGPWAKG